MTKKDIAFIKKIIGNSEYTPVMRIVSCYVNIDHNDIRFQEPQTFLRLEDRNIPRSFPNHSFKFEITSFTSTRLNDVAAEKIMQRSRKRHFAKRSMNLPTSIL